MRAVIVREFGPPDVLVPEEVPLPVAVEKEVVIDVEISNVTFVETQIRAGRPMEGSSAGWASRRFSSSRHAVRFAGLDVTVSQSDDRRTSGKLSRQGSSTLRWPVFEAAQSACRESSLDHDYYLESKERLGSGNRGCLSVARKLIRRVHHTIRAP